MTATGSHGNFDSLRGAPPFTQGSQGAPAPVRLSMFLGRTGKLYHIPYPPQKRRDTLTGARPHRLAPCGAGLSPELKKCPLDTFLPALWAGRSLRVPYPFQKRRDILTGARPHRLAPCGAGLSHGLKTVHWTVFAAVRLPPPFRVPCPFHKKNTIRKDGVLFMGWIMGLEPTIFRATI